MHTLPRLRLVVIGCLLLLTGLAGIQAYLLWNTYQLAAATYRSELKIVLQAAAERTSYEDRSTHAGQLFQRAFRQYVHHQLSKAQLLRELRAVEQATNQEAVAQLRQQEPQQPILQGVAVHSRYTALLLEQAGQVDTLLWAPARPQVPPATLFGRPQWFELGTNSGTVSLTDADTPDAQRLSVRYGQVRLVRVAAWPQRVWQRMGAVAYLTALLLAAVVVLFYQVGQSAIRQRQRAEIQTDVANNITHELKTPLSSLGLLIKTLQHPEVQQDPARWPALLASLERQHGKLNHVVARVLESAGPAPAPPPLREVDLPACLHAYAQDFTAAHHRVQFDIAPGHQRLRTDVSALEGVLNNLLDNAQKYSPAGTRLTVRAYPTPAGYCLDITDEGPGIPLAQQALVFDKFYRAPEHDLHTVKGLGLGLFLSRRAVQQLGGALTLAHSSPQGSTFRLLLPLA